MMKRIAIIIGMLLLVIVGFVWTMYTVRKNKIDKQYISNSTTSILSIAVDDLLLDNISSLPTWNNSLEKKDKGESWMKNIIFNAGIEIPARIYLFSMAPHMRQLYGILPLKDYDDCFSFFANHYPEGIDLIDKEKGIVSVVINKHINVLFDRRHIIYKIAVESNSDFKDLQSILLQPHTWTTIASIKGFEGALPQKHISYIQKGGLLQIEAMVKNDKAEVEGKWLLAKRLDDTLLMRDMDTTKQTLTFWNLLPLSEIPVLSHLLNKYTGMNLEQLNSNYFDFQVNDDYILQKDSAISYMYDDDFNVIEQTQVQEVTVPSITYSWRSNALLEAALPDTMFYKVQKKRIDQYLINTTLETFPNQVTSKQTLHPLYFFIDFERWPETWNVSVFKKLKEKKVKVRMTTTLQAKNELSINGQISF